MKPLKELVREHGTNSGKESNAVIARRAYIQRDLQHTAAMQIASALRNLGVAVEPYRWEHEGR